MSGDLETGRLNRDLDRMGARKAGRRALRAVMVTAALAGLGALAGCGGRSTSAVDTTTALDQLFTCDHLDAEYAANIRRMEDLEDERVANRLRNLTRVPGALIGNPLSALALTDLSVAIYREINALERRNARVQEIRYEKDCDGHGDTLIAAPPVTPPAPVEEPAAQPVETAAAQPAAPRPAAKPGDEAPIEPANAKVEPNDSAVAAYAALLQSAGAPEPAPLSEALKADGTVRDTEAIETSSLPERNAGEIAEMAEQIATQQRASAPPAPPKIQPLKPATGSAAAAE